LNRPFGDGEHIIYVNGDYHGQDDIGNLMNDFRSSEVDDIILEPLKETVNRYKNNPKEVAAMCADLEKWSKEERVEGFKEGTDNALNQTATRLISIGFSVEDVVKGTGLPLETVEKIKEEMERN
jgi:hypothetical protein